jgi:hypothetical protein
MQFEELRFITQQAALDVLERHARPVPPTVVLPGPARTLLLTLPDLPDDDELRHAVLAGVAADHITAEGVPCWGFVAEAEVAGRDCLVAAFGARRHVPHLSAAFFTSPGDVDGFTPEEELDPTALPFLHPLQPAVDARPGAQDVFGRYDPKRGGPSPFPGSEGAAGSGPAFLPIVGD